MSDSANIVFEERFECNVSICAMFPDVSSDICSAQDVDKDGKKFDRGEQHRPFQTRDKLIIRVRHDCYQCLA